MVREGASEGVNAEAEVRARHALAQVVYAGTETRQQADAIMARQGAGLSPQAAARYWGTGRRSKSDLAKQVAGNLAVPAGTLERHMAQVEAVADRIVVRLADKDLADRDANALVQRYAELMKCLCEMVKQTAERKRSGVEAEEGDDTTLAAILGDDMELGGPCGSTLHDATRQAAAATTTLFEAVGEAG